MVQVLRWCLLISLQLADFKNYLNRNEAALEGSTHCRGWDSVNLRLARV
jgi:hypothetical protein